jgi:hypothetical protein
MRRAGAFLLELWVATYGSMMTAAMLVYLLFPVAHFLDRTIDFRHFNRILSVQLFPLQAATGLVVGYLVWSKFDGTFKFWVWTIPLAILAGGPPLRFVQRWGAARSVVTFSSRA